MYESSILADRIRNTAKAQSVSLSSLFEKCGMGRNAMSHMTNGSMPKSDNLARIADALDCSVDYLLGRTDVLEVNKKSALFQTDESAELGVMIARLSADDKLRVAGYVEALLQEREHSVNTDAAM